MSTNLHAQQHFPPAAQRCWPSGCTVEPPIGAHLATPRDRYTHHGIYVGDGNVIHYAGFSRSWRAGPVEEVDVIEFALGHPVRVVAHPHARYSAQQIVQRARSRLGEHAFHLLRNNCEHFCNWCITGHHRSEQVERFRTVASLILRSKIAKLPDHMPEKGETGSGRSAPALRNRDAPTSADCEPIVQGHVLKGGGLVTAHVIDRRFHKQFLGGYNRHLLASPAPQWNSQTRQRRCAGPLPCSRCSE